MEFNNKKLMVTFSLLSKKVITNQLGFSMKESFFTSSEPSSAALSMTASPLRQNFTHDGLSSFIHNSSDEETHHSLMQNLRSLGYQVANNICTLHLKKTFTNLTCSSSVWNVTTSWQCP